MKPQDIAHRPMLETYNDAVEHAHRTRWAGTKDGVRSKHRAQVAGSVVGVLGFPVAKLERRHAAELVAYMQGTGSKPATVNRFLAALLTVWREAHRRGAHPSPPPDGLYLRERNARTRVVTDAEFRALVERLPDTMRPFARLLRYTGLRVSEALALDPNDFGRAQLAVRDSKNGEPRWVPFGDVVGPVTVPFQFTQSQFNHAWSTAKDIAKIQDPDLVPHALRHTRATELVAAGVPLPVVAKLLGHRSIKTTMRYTHVDTSDCVNALSRAGLL